MLEINNLDVSINKTDIITDLSLSMATHSFVGVIGANGSGKSTLLKTIYKSIKPKSGTIIYQDMDLVKASEKKMAQKIGVVGQFNELSFDLTVHQMVLLGRTPHKKMLETDSKEDLALVEKALEQLGLSAYKNRSFLSLSGGEKQRVILARALTQEPELLILDEPTNHLDIRYQIEIMETVKQLELGVLAAIHDLEMAANYCDYLYAMKQGEIIASGKPQDLLTEELINEIYDIKCHLYTNPITKKLGFHYYI